MSSESIKIDADGIPVLEDIVTQKEDVAAQGRPPPLDLSDSELIQRLLQTPSVQQALDDVTEDLQKMMAWKLESFLKEELNKLVRDAIQESGPRLSQDIRTQLELALPDLLATFTAAEAEKH